MRVHQSLCSFIVMLILVLTSFSANAINPVKEYINTPEKLGLPHQEIQLDTPDGYAINTWVLEPIGEGKQDVSFLLAYGDAGNMSYSLAYAIQLVQRGYPVILFDYRGFGQSADFDMNKNQFYYNEFVTDFQTVLKWGKSRQPDQKFAVWGFSMGTLIASLAHEAEGFDYLIGEGFVANPEQSVERIFQQKEKKLDVPNGIDSVIEKINRMAIPILFICGTEDKITTLEDVKAIVQKNPDHQVLSFDGGHLQGAQILGLPNYISSIEAFIAKK